jgi:hypothetical protein
MNKIDKFIGALFLGLALVCTARAIVIEGTTPAGKFIAVGLDANGNFKVTSASSTSHVIVDAGTTTVTGPGGGPVIIVGAVGVVLSSAAVPVTAQTSFSGGSAVVVYPAFAGTRQGNLCNTDPSSTVWLGGAAVTTASGIPLLAGGCMSPDVPSVYQGAIYGISTAAAHTAYIYYRQ